MKKISLRKCVVSNKMFAKEHLLRVCKNSSNEVFIDLTNNAPGRGAYIKKDKSIIEKARKMKAFEKSLHVSNIDFIYDDLLKKIN